MMSQSVQRNEGTDAEMVEEYLVISRLQDMGLNQSDVKKLEDAGYKSVGSFNKAIAACLFDDIAATCNAEYPVRESISSQS